MKAGKAKQEKVIFRVWKDGDRIAPSLDVIALFPEIAVDTIGYNCQSYMHIGQHGGANLNIVLRNTRLATPDEYDELYKELTRIGYDLKVIKRFRYGHQQIRMDMYK